MSASQNPLDWANKAEEDFAVARSTLRRQKPLAAISCFHSQQCAEKYLKAILAARKRGFPKIHDLLKLLNLCEQAGVFLPIDQDTLDSLTKFAVVTRYPGNAPTIEQAKAGLDTAKAVRKFARQFLGLE